MLQIFAEEGSTCPRRGEPIGYLLARIHSNMDRRANNNLKASGMTFSQMRLMHFLFKQGEATPSQKDIEDFLQVSHPTVVGLIQRLEDTRSRVRL